ncbi:uncharacterized protein LOC130649395 [Hydractinia symbiolongicarpus]|uniref:uncharacterized protein LOC130649395 n=1 Tax=Hydractinia symbiolongicarpus TaxID=13093 RepID=UPI00254A8E52|nr:uncharacterized protein LOC130649395 [Hydractinia symbiolongicarpus]
MGVFTTSFVYVFFETIRAVHGDVQFHLSYVSGMASYSTTTSGITDRLACVKDICYKEKISKQWMITAGSFYTPSSQCLCSQSKIIGIFADNGHQCAHYNFIPVHVHQSKISNGLNVGAYYHVVEVNFILHKRGNDKTTLYAIEDLNEPLNASISVNFVDTREFTDTIEPSKKRTKNRHPITKLYYSITESFEQDHEILSPQYSATIGVSYFWYNKCTPTIPTSSPRHLVSFLTPGRRYECDHPTTTPSTIFTVTVNAVLVSFSTIRMTTC